MTRYGTARAWVVSAAVLGAAALPTAQARAAETATVTPPGAAAATAADADADADTDADADKVHAAVVWPVMTTPHETAAALGSGASAQAVFDDDTLAGLFAAGGRLREVVDAGRGREVSWVLDPDLVLSAQAMADGYRLADSTGSSNPQDSTRGTGQSAARSWLAALREAVKGRDVWLLPYADPDLASLARHPGADTDDLTEVVAGLAADAKEQVDRALGTGTRTGLGWPAGGALDTAVTQLGTEFGVDRMLTSGEGLTPAGKDPVTLDTAKSTSTGTGDSGTGTNDDNGSGGNNGSGNGSGNGNGSEKDKAGDDKGKVTALPYDPGLTTALARIEDPGPDPEASRSPSLSPSPFPSATTSTTPGIGGSTGPGTSTSPSTSPSASPSLSASGDESDDTPDPAAVTHLTGLLKKNVRPVVVPPRDLSGTAANALKAALASGTDDGWLDLEGLRNADDDPVAGRAAPAAYPGGLRADDLTAAQLRAVASDLDRLATLVKVLADPKGTTASVHAAMARALSTAWRAQDDTAQRAFQRRTSAFLTTSEESLRLVQKTTLTLTSGDSTVPVTVDNGLQQPVAGLELRVSSSDAERLKVNDTKLPVEAAGSASHTTPIDVTAKANGKARITARLYTRSDGKPWGEPMTFEVDVTSVSTGAISVVAAGVVLIVAAALFRMRRVRRRRAPQPPVE